ncbi:LppW family protein [Geodermatophilus sp. CPCC 206100]|uniref:LppW family protein n=1 Tax=Geodermatophilus sp. CPCC 206100 TaxID=3020054 RepID=UPI003AFFF5C0
MAGRRPLRDHRLRRGLAALCAAAVLAGCAGHAAGQDVDTASVRSSPTAEVVPPRPVAPAVDAVRVLTDVTAAAAGAGGTVTVAVQDADGHQLLAGGDAGAPAYTASLVKVVVVTRLLQLDQAGAVPLDESDLERAQRAITDSDDDAMSLLWDRYDGARLVTDLAGELGLTGTAPPAIAGQWGQATTTAADYATVLRRLPELLDAERAGLLTGWLGSVATTAADGFDQRFGLFGRAGVKQGWMCCVDGRRQLHSAGVLPDGRVVVLLGDFPTSTTWDRARAALDGAAAAVLAGIG